MCTYNWNCIYCNVTDSKYGHNAQGLAVLVNWAAVCVVTGPKGDSMYVGEARGMT